MLKLEQISPMTFRCFMALGEDNKEPKAWLTSNFEEGVDYSYGDFSYSLHVQCFYIKFHNIEAATAFKLR